MSQSPKRPGARDISDLKARLGLKKGGPAAKRPGGAQPTGVVPPPGLRLPGGVPAPPGAQQPQPAAPSVSDDPFGAMNMIAAQGVAARAAAGPEIVVVDTSGPVESVEKKAAYLGYAKWAVMVILPLAVGVTIGQISHSAKTYNESIEHASVIAQDVRTIRGSLVSVQNALLEAKDRGPGRQAFLPNDEKLTEALAQIERPAVNTEAAYNSKLYALDPDKKTGLVGNTLELYVEVARFYRDINAHVVSARVDARAMTDGKEKRGRGGATPDNMGLVPYRFGVLLDIPSADEARGGRPPAGRLVEMGRPICSDRKPAEGGCPDGPPVGFQIRDAPSGSWAGRELSGYDGEMMQGNSKIVPLFPSDVFESVLKGSEASVAEVGYMRRVRDLESRLEDLLELSGRVESQLRSRVDAGKRFTFFL